MEHDIADDTRSGLDRQATDPSGTTAGQGQHRHDPGHHLGAALALTADGDDLLAEVHEGWDVFGIPHGGYLAALAGAAVLTATGQPDLFTITVHYNRKASFGPMRLATRVMGGSRRFTTISGVATQDDRTVLSFMASVGDRSTTEGPTWRSEEPWTSAGAELTPPAGAEGLAFTPPDVAARMGMRLDAATVGAFIGQPTGEGRIRATAELPDGVDGQLAGLVLCDLTPPAVWNALGATGWVPTLELTAHVRARPAPGTVTIEAQTTQVSDGFLEEDALVVDAEGRLLVQSRQLARASGT